MIVDIYDITDIIIGQGSYSNVHLGKDNNGNLVAVKVVNVASLDEHEIKRLYVEIDIVERLIQFPHENIVKYIKVIDDGEFVYIVMEYCDSGDLSSILGRPMKEHIAQYYLQQITGGLKHLNGMHIFHRDLKPKNIMLTNNKKTIKIADFGFAKPTYQSLHHSMCGSPLYMAPEILHKKPYSTKTDLWSIGVILYEMLFGSTPFSQCSHMPELIGVIDTPIKIPPLNNFNISNDCIYLLKKLLTKENDRLNWSDYFNNVWVAGKLNYKPQEEMFVGSAPKSTITENMKESFEDEYNNVDEEDEDIFNMSSYVIV